MFVDKYEWIKNETRSNVDVLRFINCEPSA